MGPYEDTNPEVRLPPIWPWENAADCIQETATLSQMGEVNGMMSVPVFGGAGEMNRSPLGGYSDGFLEYLLGNECGAEPDIYGLRFTSQSREANIKREDEIAFTNSGYGSAPKLKVPAIPDDQTLYSIATTYAKRYVTDLAQDIYTRLGGMLDLKDGMVPFDSLSELVKAFAIRLAHDSCLHADREVMYFIHQRHREIAAQLQDYIAHNETVKKEPHKMTLGDKMALWNGQPGAVESKKVDDELFQGIKDDADKASESGDDGDAAKLMDDNLIVGSTAYKWFISSLRNECCFHWDDKQPRVMVDDIRKPILASLPAGVISKTRTPPPHWAEFRLPRPNLDARLSEAITITGTSQHAQVATVSEYFSQTWPSSGPAMLSVLESAMGGLAAGWHSGTLPDNSHLIARRYQSWLLVMIIGPAYSIAQCGEQLAWLAAALHSRSNHHSVVYTTPSLAIAEINDGNHPAYQVLQDGKGVKQNCAATTRETPVRLTQFDIEVVESSVTGSHTPNEKPWSRVFGTVTAPVFVTGFPTARRPGNCPGLELSFKVFLGLIGTQTTSNIDGSVRLQNSQVDLQLVNRKCDTFCWHNFLATNGQPQCLSHGFISSDQWAGLAESDLIDGRHILCNDGTTPHASAISTAKANRESVPATSLSPAGSSSLDTEMLSIPSSSGILGEETEPKSLGFHLFKRVTRRLFLEYYQAEVKGLANSHGNFGTSNAQRQCNPQSQSQTPSTPSQFPSSQGLQVPQKRRPGDDDRDQPKRKRSKPQQPKDSVRRCFLSCPFWKLDSEKHWECFFKKTTTVSYVKQHLARRHTPAFYCHRCFAIFEMDVTYDQHVLTASCTRGATAKLDGISHAQSKQLSKRCRGSLEDQWFAMWDILFPGEPRPLSIYVDSDQSEDFCRVREFGQRRGVAILRDELRSSGLLLRPDVSDQQIGHVLRRGLDAIFEQFCLDQGSIAENSPSSSSLAQLDSTSQHGGSSRRISGLAELSVFSAVSQPSSNSSMRTGDMVGGSSSGRPGDEADMDAVAAQCEIERASSEIHQAQVHDPASGDFDWGQWKDDDGYSTPVAACEQLDFDELLREITQ